MRARSPRASLTIIFWHFLLPAKIEYVHILFVKTVQHTKSQAKYITAVSSKNNIKVFMKSVVTSQIIYIVRRPQ